MEKDLKISFSKTNTIQLRLHLYTSNYKIHSKQTITTREKRT